MTLWLTLSRTCWGGRSWGADYLWLDGCGLPFFSKARGGNPPLVQEKYELWSRLLRSSGREIIFQASWPDYVEDIQNHATAGTLPSNVDLWNRVGTQAHEFRFYSDVTPNWDAVLDIANTAHEWQMARFHRPGSWAFMDMLEVGVTDKNGSTFLSFEQSRSHFALWVSRDLGCILPKVPAMIVRTGAPGPASPPRAGHS